MDEQAYTFVVCEYCPFPADYQCDVCGVPVCEHHAEIKGNASWTVRGVQCMNCAATGDEEE